jgi:PilZ domain
MKPKATKREVRRMIRQQSAWITLNGEAATECRIMDISKRGAKIYPNGSAPVPDRFELAFFIEDEKRRACEVIWRRGRMLGIKFVS